MRICPKCHTNYTDETLQFCLQDGTPLVGDTGRDTGVPTESFGEEDTVVSGRESNKITFDLTDGGSEDPVTRETGVADARKKTKRSRTALTVLLTAVAMILLFGAAGLIAALFYYGSGRNQVVDRPGANASEDLSDGVDRTPAGENTNSGALFDTPLPTPTAAETKPQPTPKITPTPRITPTPPAPVNPDLIRRAAASRIYSWKSLAEARRLNPYMSSYAGRLDYYYRKRGVSRNFVRNDKRRAFSKYSTIRIRISAMRITPSRDGRSATADFDKEWYFANSSSRSTGKVRSRLLLRRSGNTWLIAGERDLKVYYVN